jgi:hypothetical protein
MGIAAAVSCAAVLTIGSSDGAGAQSVTPAAFTKTLCAAFASASTAAKPGTAAVKAAVQAYKSAPSATTATALRDAMTQAANGIDQQLGIAITTIQQAGTPANGTRFVAALISNIGAERAAAQRLAQGAAAVDMSSSTAFAQSLQQVLTQAKTDDAQLHAVARRDPAIQHAPAVFHRAVRVLTTDANTCAK